MEQIRMPYAEKSLLWRYQLAVYLVIALSVYFLPDARDKTSISVLMGITAIIVSFLLTLQVIAAARVELGKGDLLGLGLLTMLTAIMFVALIDVAERRYAILDIQSPGILDYWPYQLKAFLHHAKTWLLIGITAVGANLVVAGVTKTSGRQRRPATIRDKLRALRDGRHPYRRARH